MEASRGMATVVTGVIGDDVHVIGIRIMEHALRTAGFNVVALGIQVSQEEFINAAIETNAQAIMVSSLNGHAEILVSGFREKCTEAGLKNIPVYLGGQLVIGEVPWEDVTKRLGAMGIDRIYSPDSMPEQVIVDLKADLNL